MCDLILFESALGYGLFRVSESDEIVALAEQMQSSISDFSRVSKIISLAKFVPFRSAEEALENCNSVSEGAIPNTLKVFLEANVKKEKLGVIDEKLASAIQENLSLSVVKSKYIIELTRGIRTHFHTFLKGVSENDVIKAELGLGHSYSRSKVKFNVNKVDNMIIQAIFLLDQLEKDINTNSMRLREWYGWHFPELARIVDDHGLYASCIRCIGDRSKVDPETLLPKLEEILDDAGKAAEIIEAIKTSTGFEISSFDMASITVFSSRVLALAQYRKDLQQYLAKKMSDVAPNLRALIGDVVGARLISHAGSLTNLAKSPASTVQILGAEKALFRALKTRGNTPKYGIIYHSSFIGRAGTKNKGRISRYLANKCSIASRIDSFSSGSNDVFGKILKEQVEERLKFYEDGTTPRKNIDCMKAAMADEEIDVTSMDVEEPKSGKKKTPKKAEKKEIEKSEEEPKKKTPKKAEKKEIENSEEKPKSGKKKTPKKAEKKEIEKSEEEEPKSGKKKTPKKVEKKEIEISEEEEPKSGKKKTPKKAEKKVIENSEEKPKSPKKKTPKKVEKKEIEKSEEEPKKKTPKKAEKKEVKSRTGEKKKKIAEPETGNAKKRKSLPVSSDSSTPVAFKKKKIEK